MADSERPTTIDPLQEQLLPWYRKNKRSLPWRQTSDPYKIWLSEVILQQTRVEHGLPYYEKFVDRFPDVHSFGKAPEDEVMKMWEGLGYYNRARHMMEAAQQVIEKFNGHFPDNYNELLELKGVGPYTAAAIASFAYGEPQPVVDGNVFRVLSRYFGDPTPIDSTEGKKRFNTLAEKILDKENPGEHNQAIMEFGALQCTNRNPDCKSCPVHQACTAYQEDRVHQYPVKEKTIQHTYRYFNYLVIRHNQQYFIRKREEDDVWRNLYEFPYIESEHLLSKKELTNTSLWGQVFDGINHEIKGGSVPYKQTLSHQKIRGSFWEIKLEESPQNLPNDWIGVTPDHLEKYAFPRIIICYLETKILSLPLR